MLTFAAVSIKVQVFEHFQIVSTSRHPFVIGCSR